MNDDVRRWAWTTRRLWLWGQARHRRRALVKASRDLVDRLCAARRNHSCASVPIERGAVVWWHHDGTIEGLGDLPAPAIVQFVSRRPCGRAGRWIDIRYSAPGRVGAYDGTRLGPYPWAAKVEARSLTQIRCASCVADQEAMNALADAVGLRTTTALTLWYSAVTLALVASFGILASWKKEKSDG